MTILIRLCCVHAGDIMGHEVKHSFLLCYKIFIMSKCA